RSYSTPPASSRTSIPQMALRSSGAAAARSMRVAVVVTQPVSNRLSESKFFKRWRMIEVVFRGSNDAMVAQPGRNSEGFQVRAVVAGQAIDGCLSEDRRQPVM